MRISDIVASLARKLAPASRRQVDYDPAAWQRLDDTWDNRFTEIGWTDYRLNIVHWVLGIQDDHREMLDTSCHIGHFIEALRNRGYTNRYQGVDITLQFVARARERLPSECFDVGDVRALDFSDKSFDLVMCVGVLMHLPEIKTPLAEVCRVARKYVLLSTYGSSGESYSRHAAKGGFLNHYYSKEDVLAAVPSGWNLVDYREFERSDIRRHNMIFQFLLKKQP